MTQPQLDFTARNNAKIKMEDRCFEMMEADEGLCNDNTHLLACRIIEEDFNVIITPEIVSKLRSIDRSRQKVLANHPGMDRRKRAVELELNDREYYSPAEDTL